MPAPVDLSKLSDVVKNDVVKKTEYDKLVAKVDNIDTSRFVLKTKYDRDKSELENKIPDPSGLVKKTDYGAKITDIESKIPDVSNLVTKTALTTVENKIPNITQLNSKSDHDKEINKSKNNYVTNSVLTSKLRGYVPYSDYNLKILLLENELEKYSLLNCYVMGKSYFGR